MHGLGNDYVFITGFEESVEDPSSIAPAIADRHFGVGGDGLILLLPPDDGVDAHIQMRMFNADGSEAEMCGNGVRCLCKLAYDRDVCREKPMRVQTGAGVLTLNYRLSDNDRVEEVSVDMGAPILTADEIPVANIPADENGRVIDAPLGGAVEFSAHGPKGWTDAAGLDPRMTCVSMGNPHAIFFCDDTDAVPLEHIGPVLEHASIFPNRINVHFVSVDGPEELTMATWERGSGITLACGTGASAVCVAGVLTGRAERRVLAHLPGGDLRLHWDESTDHVEMTGPATEVFTGTWPVG